MKRTALPFQAVADAADDVRSVPAAAAGGPRVSAYPRGGLPSALLLVFLLGLSHYFLSTPGVDIPTERTLSALAWPAPAIGMALLWRRRLREWPFYLLAMGAALLLVGRLDWLPLPVDLMFAAIGVAQAALGAWIGRRWVARDGRLGSLRQLLRFLVCLPLGMSALHAAVTGTVLWWMLDAAWLEQAGRIYTASALAVLTLVPALLAAEVRFARRDGAAALTVLIGSTALALVPDMSGEVVRALLTLPLCWAALRAGLSRVACFNASTAVGLVGVTFAGLGPYAHRGEQGIWALQVDLIGLSLLSLFLAVAIDEQRRLAQRLEQGRRFESLGFLAGGIAHDFNNLLGTIGACAEIAAERLPADAPGRGELAQLEREAARGRDMTQQLLLAARLGDPARAAVKLDDVVAEVLASTQALRSAQVQLLLACEEETGGSRSEPTPGTWVLAHRGQLVRAVHNLLRNATLAARSQVRLRVGVAGSDADGDGFQVQVGERGECDGRRMGWIEVSDDGPGIAPQHWAHLFDPFYSTRLAQGGSGLGLAIVAGVATGHGGWVGMRTDAGRGSRFRLALPLVTGDPTT